MNNSSPNSQSPQILVDLERTKYLYSGLGQFCHYLFQQFSSKKTQHLNFLLPRQYCESENVELTNSKNIELVSLKRKIAPSLCKKYDLWHSTHQDSDYFPSSKNEKYLLTIHDLNFLQEKSEKKIKLRLSNLQKKIDRASAITVISEFTKTQIKKHLDVKDKPIHLVYNGVDFSNTKTEVKSIKNISKPFLFTLGVLQPKKNFHVLIEFLKQIDDVNLVIAGDSNGNDEYKEKIQKLISKHGLSDRVIMTGFINEGERTWLYQNCKAFVFPSLLEGFGLPVIEAMSFSKPVFISNKTSLPEIGGKEAYYWNDFSAKNMAEIFNNGMADFNKDSSKAGRIQANAERFSWEKAASQYLEVYQSILK